MQIGTLSEVVHESGIFKNYFKKIHKYTPEGMEDKFLAKVSGNRLADKHGKHPALAAVPTAVLGGLAGFGFGGPVGSAAGAAIGGGIGAGVQYLKRKLHKNTMKKD